MSRVCKGGWQGRGVPFSLHILAERECVFGDDVCPC